MTLGFSLPEDVVFTPPTALSDIFEEEPVGIDVFLRDKKFLGADWSLSPRQEELVQHVERVLFPSTFERMADEFGGYWAMTRDVPVKNLFSVEVGKGGGKDSTTRVGILRIVYLLLCMHSPQTYFGMPEDDTIHLLNIAKNAPQARLAFFDPMKRMVKRGWMADKSDPVQNQIVFAKNLLAISGHSDAESQEGLNLLAGVADEIDAFTSKTEKSSSVKVRESSTSAESIVEMLESSAKSRFPQTYKRVAISYPRYLGSSIQRLRLAGEADVKKYGDSSVHYPMGPYATWEFNPTKSKEDFAPEYREDPITAAAKYECKPYRATDAYFRNPSIFRQAVDRQTQPISVDYEIRESLGINGEIIKGWEPVYSFDPDFKGVDGAIYALHADLAVKGDKAGVSLSHVKQWDVQTQTLDTLEGIPDTVDLLVPTVKNDFTFSFSADISAVTPDGETLPREIQIRWVRELVLKELRSRGFTIGMVSFDGFQSVDSMQVLESYGVKTRKLSTDIDASIWKTLKDVASDGRLSLPYNLTLQEELEALSRVGGKVDHPPFGSKDLADAFACSITSAVSLGGQESEEPPLEITGGDDNRDTYSDFSAPMWGFEVDFESLPLGFEEIASGKPSSFPGY